MPDAVRDGELGAVVGGEVFADDVGFGVAVGVELEHLDRVAEVVVEDLVALEEVHLAEGVGFEQVVDGRGGVARAGVAGVWELRGCDEFRGLVGAGVPAAFAGMRLEVEDALDVGGGHGFSIKGIRIKAGRTASVVELAAITEPVPLAGTFQSAGETLVLDVHPPHHAVSSWRDFFIHIATICIGLLIAVGLEQSIEALHHHHQREYLEEQMHAESVQNLELVRAQILFTARRIEYLKACIQALQSATPSNGQLLVTLPVDNVSLPSSSQGLLISPSQGTWAVAKAAGTVVLLPAEIAKVYTRLDLSADFEQRAEIETGRTAAVLASARLQDHAASDDGVPNRLTQAQVDDLLHAFGVAYGASVDFHFRLVVLEGALEAVVANATNLQQMYPYQFRAIAREGAEASSSGARNNGNAARP